MSIVHDKGTGVLQPLNVHFLPALMNTANLAGGTVVIIDILRASSTIITALHNGAKRVIPCGTSDEARKIREPSQADAVLLGGERGGVLIEGFDCGNSPTEYAPHRVAGKTIAFTTTNGTQALLKSAAAETILIGAFINRQAVVDRRRCPRRSLRGTRGDRSGRGKAAGSRGNAAVALRGAAWVRATAHSPPRARAQPRAPSD